MHPEFPLKIVTDEVGRRPFLAWSESSKPWSCLPWRTIPQLLPPATILF